jgi:hypothetical protein
LNANFEWRLYQLILLFISAPVIGLFVLWLVSKLQGVKEELKPDWFSYKQDNFDNVVYRWEWLKAFDGKYHVNNIVRHCSKCECYLVNDSCPNCKSTYYGVLKPDYEVEALILHRATIIEKMKLKN